MQKKSLFLLPLFFSITVFAFAENQSPWRGNLAVELNKSSLLDADDDSDFRHKTYLKTELELQYLAGENLSFHSRWVLEPVQSADRSIAFFQEEGLYLEEAFVALKVAEARLQLGKFNPLFGVAWDEAPGMYGDDITDEYEITEKVGASAQLDLFNGKLSEHRLTLAAFTADRSAFSDSVFTRRGRADKVPGQSTSGSIALDGRFNSGAPGLSYHLGWRRLAEFADIAEENDGYAAALRYQVVLSRDVALNFLYEWIAVEFATAGSLRYRTPALILAKGPFVLGISRTEKRVAQTLPLEDLSQDQLSFRYYFKDTAYFGIGLKQSNEGDYLGMRLQSTFDL